MLHLGDRQIQAALFDLDGTLVHTRIDFALMRREMRRLASKAGVPTDALDDKEILEMVSAAADHAGGGAAGEILRRAMWSRLEEIERVGGEDASEIAGARDLLAHLRAHGVKIGVVTRNCRAVSAPLLERFALSADVLLTRDDVARAKPDPAHLYQAMAVLGVKAGESVMVGDHWLDVRAGQEAGCAATIGVLGERDPSWFDACAPTYIVRDLAQAIPLFNGAI